MTKVAQWQRTQLRRLLLGPVLCDPMDRVAPQAPLSMWILQARVLENVAMPSSKVSSQPRD